MEFYNDDFGGRWMTDICLTYGPYGGGRAVAAANITWLEDNALVSVVRAKLTYMRGDHVAFECEDGADLSAADAVIVAGSFGGKTAFIRCGGALQEDAEALENYPAFDDSMVYQVECDWEAGAWPDTLDDLLAAAPTANLRRYFTDRKEDYADELWQAYREAMEAMCVYPVPEYDTVYIDTDKIAGAFWANVINALKTYHAARWANK